jgi:hypothetical protein
MKLPKQLEYITKHIDNVAADGTVASMAALDQITAYIAQKKAEVLAAAQAEISAPPEGSETDDAPAETDE